MGKRCQCSPQARRQLWRFHYERGQRDKRACGPGCGTQGVHGREYRGSYRRREACRTGRQIRNPHFGLEQIPGVSVTDKKKDKESRPPDPQSPDGQKTTEKKPPTLVRAEKPPTE